VAETNAVSINDAPLQTTVQPPGELKSPKVFAGAVLFIAYFGLLIFICELCTDKF